MGLLDVLTKRIMGRKSGDIQLPNESGRVDPRLPKRTHEMEGLRQAGQRVRQGLRTIKEVKGY